MLLVAFSAVTAATQLTVGDVRRSPAASAMLRAIMVEAWSVGRALGIPLADDLVDRQHKLVLEQADDEGTSLRHDLLIGHRMELDALQGTLRRLGRETGIPTPWTDAVYAILEPLGDSQRAEGETRPSDRVPDAPTRSRASYPARMAHGPFAIEPPRERPDSPPKARYGVPPTGGRFIEWGDVIERLTVAEGLLDRHGRPDGRPHVVPVVGTLFEGDLFLETGSPLTVKNRTWRPTGTW